MTPFWTVLLAGFLVINLILLLGRYTPYYNFRDKIQGRRVPLFPGATKLQVPLIAGVACAIIAAFWYTGIGAERYEETSEFSIAALGDSTTVTGRFFLGSGTVKGEQTYAYMYKTADGGFKMGSLVAAQSTIYEDADAGTARIEAWIGVNDTWLDGGKTNTLTIYKIHIPPNSIVQNYNVDVTN